MIRSFLSRSPLYVLALYASVLIFLVYTCAYAYRKPFTAAIYEGDDSLGIRCQNPVCPF